MTPLGKPLVFYLKYQAEMDHLYGDPEYGDGEEPDLTGLDDAEHVREMVRTVGATAYEQAMDFLKSCGKEIKDHFTRLGIATLAGERRRSHVIQDWDWGVQIHVSSVPDGSFYCGVWLIAPPTVRISIKNDVCGVVVPWLWVKDSRKGGDAIWKILGDWVDSRASKGLFDDGDTIALAHIPIKAQPPASFDVDREQLIKEVMKTISQIGTKQTKTIATFAAKLNKSNET